MKMSLASMKAAHPSPGVASRVAVKPLPRRPGIHTPSHNARAAARRTAPKEVTGIVFQPFTEVQTELATVDKTDSALQSFARCDFHPACEAAINEQINIEYNISYVYHALFAFFDRDNVGLPGLASHFKHSSEEEREHAEKLMEYQNVRGGQVKLGGIVVPETEFNHPDKGEALYAMELSLSLEKLNFQKLRLLHDVAETHNDDQMCDFIESELLAEQVEDIKQVSVYVSQLRRVGKGHGVYHFDRTFKNGA